MVAATSEPGRVVTNGMSQYSRNERNANAGIVVGIEPRDFPDDAAGLSLPPSALSMSATPAADTARHPLAGIVLQRQLESHAYVLGGARLPGAGPAGGRLRARKQPSTQLGGVEPSYKPGVTLGDLSSRPARLRHRRDARSAARVWPKDQGL